MDLKSVNSKCQNFASFSTAISATVGGLSLKNKPIICGGWNEITNLPDCYEYDNDNWDTFSSMSVPRKYAAASTVPGTNRLIVSGGEDQNGAEELTENGWTTAALSPLAVFMSGHCMVHLDATRIMFIGGRHNYNRSPETYIYNYDDNTWEKGPDLNSRRENHACGKILKDKMSNEFTVIVAGGFNEEYMDSVEVLDMESMSWTTGPSLTVGTYFASMVEIPSGGVLLVGGSSLTFNYLNTIHMLEHAEDSWQELDQKLETGRKEFTAFLIPDELTSCSEN